MLFNFTLRNITFSRRTLPPLVTWGGGVEGIQKACYNAAYGTINPRGNLRYTLSTLYC
jgi:hypothetical protein